MEKDLIKGIVYVKFDENVGPTPVAWMPENLALEFLNIINMKCTSILAGEDGLVPEAIAMVPIPSQNLNGLIKCLTIKDESLRGGANDGSLTLLIKEGSDSIFYKYMSNFESVFEEATAKIAKLEEAKADKSEIQAVLVEFNKSILATLSELHEVENKAEDLAFPTVDKKGAMIDVRKYKVIVVGDPGVGKTSTVLRFTDSAFRNTYIPTIGVSMSQKKFMHGESAIEFVLWDIAGQAKFQTMRKLFYEGANAQLLVFDLTRPGTLIDLRKWADDINSILPSKLPGIIVGNKSDLVDQRKVSDGEIEIIAKKLNMNYFITSALSGDNVDESFHKLTDAIINFYKNQLKL